MPARCCCAWCSDVARRPRPDTAGGVQRSMQHGLPDLVRYLTGQMAAGRLRRMDPVVAVQLLAGPIVAHEMTRWLDSRPRANRWVPEVAEVWLRAMAPKA